MIRITLIKHLLFVKHPTGIKSLLALRRNFFPLYDFCEVIFLVYVRSFLGMRATEPCAVMLNGFELCGIYTCPGSTLAGFVKRLWALEQRHLCQPDVTEQKIEPCLVSTLPFSTIIRGNIHLGPHEPGL